MGGFSRYIDALRNITAAAVLTDRGGTRLDTETTIVEMGRRMRACHEGGNKLMFVGNGGSAGICSHMAIDYSKNGRLRSTAFNDGAALTCLGNDLGYEQVFAAQIEFHGRAGDILIAISSSGQSRNILNAVDAARRMGCSVYTLSGFTADNSLRGMGDINVYVDSQEYGFVEVGHLAILHSVLDIEMGWAGR
jgi:D-sedoheptulose 7-phosphate isomerase